MLLIVEGNGDVKAIVDFIMGRISAYTGEIVCLSDLAANAASAHYNRLCTPAAINFEKGDVKAPEKVLPVPGKA